MKKLTLILIFLVCVTSNAQSLNQIFSKYIQPKSTVAELKEGLKKVKSLCAVSPQEKCSKAKATVLYLLSDKYYGAAYQVIIIDSMLARPILRKANTLYKQANAFKPINEFTETQKNMILENRHYLEAYKKVKIK